MKSKVTCICATIISLLFFSCGSSIKNDHAPVAEIRERISHNLEFRDFSTVVSACDTLIILDNKDSWAYEKKAVALYYLERFEESVKASDTALAHNSNSFDAYFARGNAKKQNGDSIGALNDYSHALKLDSNSIVALNNRGGLYLKLDQYDSALADFRKLIALDSTYTTAWSNLAVLYSDLGKYDSAIFYYNKAIAVKGREMLYYGRGLTYFESGQFELAVADFTQALRYNPSNPLSYLHRAYAYAELGKKTQMCDDITRAMELGNRQAQKDYELNCRPK